MKNYEAEKLKKIIKAKEEAMVIQAAETDELRKELTKLESSLFRVEESKLPILPDVCIPEGGIYLDKYGNGRCFNFVTKEIEVVKYKK